MTIGFISILREVKINRNILQLKFNKDIDMWYYLIKKTRCDNAKNK